MKRPHRMRLLDFIASLPLLLLLVAARSAGAGAATSDCANRTEAVLLDGSKAYAAAGGFARVVSNQTCGSDAHEARMTGRVSPVERLSFAALGGGGLEATARFAAHSTNGRYGRFAAAFAVSRRRGGTVSVDETHDNDTLTDFRTSISITDSCRVVLRDAIAVLSSWLAQQLPPEEKTRSRGGGCLVVRRRYERLQYSTLSADTTVADSRLHAAAAASGGNASSVALLGRIADGRGLLAVAATHVRGSTLGSLLLADQLSAVVDTEATYNATVAGSYVRLLRSELYAERVVGDASHVVATTNLSDNSLQVGARMLIAVTECGGGATVRTDYALVRNHAPEVSALWRYARNSGVTLAGALRSDGDDASRRVEFDVDFTSNNDTSLSLSIVRYAAAAAARIESLRMRVRGNRNSSVALHAATGFIGSAADAAAEDLFDVTGNWLTSVNVDYYFCPGDGVGAAKERIARLVAHDNVESTVRLSVCWCRRADGDGEQQTSLAHRLHVLVVIDGAADGGSYGSASAADGYSYGNASDSVAPTNSSVVRVSIRRPPRQSFAASTATSARVTRSGGDCVLIELRSGSARRGGTVPPSPAGGEAVAAADNATDGDGLLPWLACCACHGSSGGGASVSDAEQRSADVQMVDLLKGGSGDDLLGGEQPWIDEDFATRAPGLPSSERVNAYLLYGLVAAAVVAVTATAFAAVACVMYRRHAKGSRRQQEAVRGGGDADTPPPAPRTAWLDALGPHVVRGGGDGRSGGALAAVWARPSQSSASGLCRGGSGDSGGERDEQQPYFIYGDTGRLSSFSSPPPAAPPPPPPLRVHLQSGKPQRAQQLLSDTQNTAATRQYSASGYMYVRGAAPRDSHSYVEIH